MSSFNVSQMIGGYIHHFGITVSDMNRSIKFYTEVLGGQIITTGTGFSGPEIHSSLLKHEIETGQLSTPNLNGEHQLDVVFIQFSNAVIELLRYHTPPPDDKTFPAIPNVTSSPAVPNAMHVCFHVRPEVNFEEFHSAIERESHALGFTQVKCNPIFKVVNPGADFDGWNLIYCKGPDGEQLEFVQTIRRAQEVFSNAGKSYQSSQPQYE